nr:uncharacterized protein LOC112578235 [Bubalus bubalis]
MKSALCPISQLQTYVGVDGSEAPCSAMFTLIIIAFCLCHSCSQSCPITGWGTQRSGHLQSEIPTCGARGMRAWPLSRSSPRYLPFPCTVVQDGRVHLLGQVGSRPRNFLRAGSRGRGWGQGSRGGRSALGRRLPVPHVLLVWLSSQGGRGRWGALTPRLEPRRHPRSFRRPPTSAISFFVSVTVRCAPLLVSPIGLAFSDLLFVSVLQAVLASPGPCPARSPATKEGAGLESGGVAWRGGAGLGGAAGWGARRRRPASGPTLLEPER